MAMIYEDWCPVLAECRMRILKSGGNTDICLFALNWLECVGMNYQTHSNLVQGFCFFCRSLSHRSGQHTTLPGPMGQRRQKKALRACEGGRLSGMAGWLWEGEVKGISW